MTLKPWMILTSWLLALSFCLPMKKFQNFQELLAAGWNYIKNVCKFHKLHIMFDSYFADSLKECERETCELVNLYILIVYRQVSSQLERFWSCGEKKKKKVEKIKWNLFS